MIKNILITTSVFSLPINVVRNIYIGNAVFIMLFLLFFQPFQLYRSSFIDLLSVAMSTGCYILSVGIGSNYLIRKWLQDRKLRRKNLFLIELAMSFSTITFVTLAVFLTRIVVIVRELLLVVKAETIDYSELDINEESDPIISLKNLSTSDVSSFFLSEFIYANSDGNYVELHLMKNNTISFTLLRCTLKSFSENFEKHESCLRCHRSYFVNMNKVRKIVRENNSARLIIMDSIISIPVSRGQIKNAYQFRQ